MRYPYRPPAMFKEQDQEREFECVECHQMTRDTSRVTNTCPPSTGRTCRADRRLRLGRKSQRRKAAARRNMVLMATSKSSSRGTGSANKAKRTTNRSSGSKKAASNRKRAS